MEEMKHQDGFKPSAEDTEKLNEIVTWLTEHGYHGLMLIHKDGIGISWVNEKGPDEVRHTFINSIGHILEESETAALNLAKGMMMAVKQIQESL